MQITGTIQQVSKTNNQNTANKGTNNNTNNSAAVAQSTVARSDTVTLSKKSVALAAKTATKNEPNVEKAFGRQENKNVGHRLGVSPVTKETLSQSSGDGHGNEADRIDGAGGGSGNVNAVSLFSLSNNINNALESYKDVQKMVTEPGGAVGALA